MSNRTSTTTRAALVVNLERLAVSQALSHSADRDDSLEPRSDANVLRATGAMR